MTAPKFQEYAAWDIPTRTSFTFLLSLSQRSPSLFFSFFLFLFSFPSFSFSRVVLRFHSDQCSRLGLIRNKAISLSLFSLSFFFRRLSGL